MPFGYATMLVIAALPPLWRRVMDRRVIEHYGGDIRLAALSERYATGDAAFATNGLAKSMTPDLRLRPGD